MTLSPPVSLFLSLLAIVGLRASHCTKWGLSGADTIVIHFSDGNIKAK